MRISVVIPVYNEALALGAVLTELTTTFAETGYTDFELLVVDDASTDRSAHVVQVFEGAPLRWISHEKRMGSGAARRTGSRAALGDYVGWIDADQTYPAAALPAMFEQLRHCDQVIGSRRVERGHTPRLRAMVKSVTAATAGVLWRTRIPDLNSGLRVFRRTALLEWIDELPDGFSCTTTATLAALNRGQAVAFHPIDYRARPIGSHSKFHPLIDTWKLWKVVFRQWRRRHVGRSRASRVIEAATP